MPKRRLYNEDDPDRAPEDADQRSYTAKLRPVNGLRCPDRLTYQDHRQPKKGKGKGSQGKSTLIKGKARQRFIPTTPVRDLYAENLFTWIRRPKFLEDFSSDASGGAFSLLPSPDVASTSSSLISVVKSSRPVNDHDAIVFRQFQREFRLILTSMYADVAPFGFHIPAWFWDRLRPCDRFLLMKRLFVVDLSSIDGAVINNVADNRIVNKLKQLHVVVGPDADQTNAMKIPNVCAHLLEVYEFARHPRNTRKLQDAKHFSVSVDAHNSGRLNICLLGDGFLLKLWTDDRDFSRFTGQYQKEVFLPTKSLSVRASFRAEACMEDSLSLDSDYLESKRVSIRRAFQKVVVD